MARSSRNPATVFLRALAATRKPPSAKNAGRMKKIAGRIGPVQNGVSASSP
jgi:hypothetical protein